jgi:hypothetical protein
MADVRWLTYDEMARALRITREGARQLTIRKRWPRRKGNDRKACVGVPEEALTSDDTGSETSDQTSEDGSDRTSSDASEDGSEDTSPIRVLLRHIERLEHELATIKQERDAALARASDRDALQAVLAIERGRVEEWKAVADRFAAQTEQVLAAQARRSWWPWRRRA